jgi:hypothetical protein
VNQERVSCKSGLSERYDANSRWEKTALSSCEADTLSSQNEWRTVWCTLIPGWQNLGLYFHNERGTLWRALILRWQKLEVPSPNEWRTLLDSLILAWQGVGFRSQNNVTNLLMLLHSRSRNLSMLTHSAWQNADLQNECRIPWRSFTLGRRSVLVYAQNEEANPLAFTLSWLAESTFCNHKPNCTSYCAHSLPRPR